MPTTAYMKEKVSQPKEYHYAIDAAQLILKCRQKLHEIILPSKSSKNEESLDDADASSIYTTPEVFVHGVNPNVLDLDRTLLSIEQLLHYHLLTLVEDVKAKSFQMKQQLNHACLPSHPLQGTDICRPQDEEYVDLQFSQKNSFDEKEITTLTNVSLGETIEELKRLSSQKQKMNHRGNINKRCSSPGTVKKSHSQSIFRRNHLMGKVPKRVSYPPRQEYEDDLLPSNSSQSSLISPTSSFGSISSNPSFQYTPSSEKSAIDSLLFRLIVILQLCLVRIDEAHRIIGNKSRIAWIVAVSSGTLYSVNRLTDIIPPTYHMSCCQISKGLTLTATTALLRKGWMKLCLNTRLLNTSTSLEDWQQQWLLMQSIGLGDKNKDEQCKRLLKLIPLRRSYSIWGSDGGGFRYKLIRWLMDCVYASVGTTIRAYNNSGNKDPKQGRHWSLWMRITAAAAASYYAVTGPSGKSAEVLSSSTDVESSDLIQNAWGMMSSPQVKTLSLQASRLLKGAAVAERIEIAGVPCFILSKNHCPALSTAIKRYRRQQKREKSHLGTIIEEQVPYERSKARTINMSEYPVKDIIFHLTGGGFFAHTLAGDIPFLLDWSKQTNAIVICPEYPLLPEHKFPTAINDITKVFMSITGGEAVPLIGFQVGKVIVTGESTGGNLAAALCIKLCKDGLVDVTELRNQRKKLPDNSQFMIQKVRLPDALLLR